MDFIAFNDLDTARQEAVWNLYETSFPAHERRSRSAQQTAFGDELAHGDLVLDEKGRVAALLFYWTQGELLFVEFLAVDPAMRGHQLGSRIMTALREKYPAHTLVLEIEPPIDELTIRRLHFYERLGFHRNDYDYTHPSYRTGAQAHPHQLVILSQGQALDPARYEEFLTLMREKVWRYAD